VSLRSRDDIEHDANLFGALALVVADRVSDALRTTVEPESAAAALSALNHFLDRPTIDLLGRVLGLTSSGTVRLVDKLEAANYVRRGAGQDKRSTSISLTSEGRLLAERVSSARADVLRGALQALSQEDRDALETISSRLLVALMRPPGATRWMCRLCDTEACGRPRGLCPVYNAAIAQYGADQKP
jgi:DNA-binding MarR family transcriptional regulator